MKSFNAYDLLPEFPRTPHLHESCNLEEGDVVASEDVSLEIMKRDDLIFEEKIDGANVGVCYYKGNFYVRNRRNILNKGYLSGDRASQRQFRPLWNWLEQHKGQFQLLNRMTPFSEDDPATVYGEWCWMAHGIQYTELPSFFIALDLYDPRSRTMLYDRFEVRRMLEAAHFSVPPLVCTGYFCNFDRLANQTYSKYYYGLSEGFYLRIPDWTNKCERRYKMVRSDFKRGQFFRDHEIIRNLLKRA